MQPPPKIWTIGHSTHPVGELVELLRRHGIGAVADVRRYPSSRRHPQFDAAALAGALARAGIGYAGFVDLGGRRTAREGSTNTAWRNASFRGYADYMETPAYAQARERLLAFAQVPCALMCAESLWWRCHRALISDDLKARGTTVLHIGARGELTEHPFTGAARVVGNRLVYGPGNPGLFEDAR